MKTPPLSSLIGKWVVVSRSVRERDKNTGFQQFKDYVYNGKLVEVTTDEIVIEDIIGYNPKEKKGIMRAIPRRFVIDIREMGHKDFIDVVGKLERSAIKAKFYESDEKIKAAFESFLASLKGEKRG